jgi:hypothetical protein
VSWESERHPLDSHLTRVRHGYVRLQARRVVGSKLSLLGQWNLLDYALQSNHSFLKTFFGFAKGFGALTDIFATIAMTTFLKWSSTGILSCVLSFLPTILRAPCRTECSSRNLQHAENVEIADPICRTKRLRGHPRTGLALGYLLRAPE